MEPPIEMTAAADRAGEAAFAEAIELAAELRRDRTRLSARLPILYEKLDAFHEAALHGVPIACKAGCSTCCSQWVPGVTAFEIERIAMEVELALDRDWIVRELLARVIAHDSLPDLDQDGAYARLGLPCVFLTSERTCGIRPIRPETCRSFFSFGPPELCGGDPDATGFMLSPHESYQDVLTRAAEAFVGGRTYSGELIRDLLSRLANG